MLYPTGVNNSNCLDMYDLSCSEAIRSDFAKRQFGYGPCALKRLQLLAVWVADGLAAAKQVKEIMRHQRSLQQSSDFWRTEWAIESCPPVPHEHATWDEIRNQQNPFQLRDAVRLHPAGLGLRESVQS